MSYLTKRQEYLILQAQLESDRSSFISHWRDISDHVFPRRQRFTVTDVNKGDRRNLKIYDTTPVLAARTLRSGMMSGITSPARPWFRLTTPDHALSEVGPVKEWLYQVETQMSHVFLKSNLYNCLPIVYGDMGSFGTSALFIEEDINQVVRFNPFPIGSYSISNNYRRVVDTFSRKFMMTVRQLVEEFGEENISPTVKNYWDTGHRETWIEISHIIKPNPDYDAQSLSPKHKKYISCYFEAGKMGSNPYLDDKYDKYLRESGYDLFPVLCPRWEITGEDSYGTECPGMTALGDIKQLQLQEKRIAQAVEKMVNPPMVGPTSLREAKASIIPGDITYVDVRDGMQGFKPAHEINFRVDLLENKQIQTRERISRCFYEDLFLMLSNLDRRQITATEIQERHEEKLLALGPVLEQLNQDLLDPLIDVTFQIMQKQGRLPPPPEELQGMELRVEYISVMAQAQKVIGIGGIERFAQFGSQLAQVNPEMLDKIDFDQVMDVYGELTSVPPSVIRTDEKVAEIRQGRAQQMKAQQQAEMIQAGAGAAKDLSQAKLEDDSALSRLLSQGRSGSLV